MPQCTCEAEASPTDSGFRIPDSGFRVTGLPGYRVTGFRVPGYRVTGLPGYRVTGFRVPGYRTPSSAVDIPPVEIVQAKAEQVEGAEIDGRRGGDDAGQPSHLGPEPRLQPERRRSGHPEQQSR